MPIDEKQIRDFVVNRLTPHCTSLNKLVASLREDIRAAEFVKDKCPQSEEVIVQEGAANDRTGNDFHNCLATLEKLVNSIGDLADQAIILKFCNAPSLE